MRPVVGSIASTEPLAWPSAFTAICRISGSSYVVLSSLVGSPYALTPLLFLWWVCVVARADVVGVAPEAMANAPAKNKQKIGTACFKAGLPIGPNRPENPPHQPMNTQFKELLQVRATGNERSFPDRHDWTKGQCAIQNVDAALLICRTPCVCPRILA